jgi:hypothetical protein
MKSAGYKEKKYNKDYNEKKRQPPDYVVYGNPKQAKLIFVSAYDTCSKVFIPNYLYYPLNEVKNGHFNRLNGMAEMGLIVLCACICVLLLRFIGVDLSFSGIGTLCTLSPVVVFGLMIYKITQGLPNSPNFNRNSAALVLMYAVANDLAVKKNAAFVFCDKSCSSYEGYIRFSLECPKELRQKIVLLNCIGYGMQLLLAHKKAGCDRAALLASCKGSEEIVTVELSEDDAKNSIFTVLPESLMLFSAEKRREEFAVRNTRTKKDGKLNTVRMEDLKALFLKYINSE